MTDSSALAALRAHGPRLIGSIENGTKRHKASFALQSLAESLQRLALSYGEYQKAAQRYRLDKRINPAGPSGAIQTALHDAHHTFHQCVYATLSSLVSSMNQVKDTKADPYPTRTISDFLDVLHSRDFVHRIALQGDVSTLRRSILYRAEYIDHPQQRQPHTWATYDYFGKEHLLYYGPFDKPRDPATIPDWEESSQDPEHPKFRPPLGVPDWYIAPRVDTTYDALQRVVVAALKLM